MTTFNPSHNPFRTSSGRHAQAIHRPSPETSDDGDLPSKKSGPSIRFPDDLPLSDTNSDSDSDSDLGVDDERVTKGRKEGRRRVKAGMMPIPEMRFEQVSSVDHSLFA